MTAFGPGFIAGGDPNTKVLLHMDGANGGTVFTDSANPSRVWSPVGLVVTNNTQVKFGATSLYCGVAQGDISAAFPDPGFDFSGDFTVDFWFWRSGGDGTFRRLFGQSGSPNNIIEGSLTDANTLRCIFTAGGTNLEVNSSPTTITTTGWHHYAVTRSGTSLRLFLDGSVVNSRNDASGAVAAQATAFTIGAYGAGTDRWNGWIDEFRLSNVARWTSNFTPPTAPYI